MKKALLLTILLVFPALANAQTSVNLCGTVRDEAGRPIDKVTVTSINLQTTIVSIALTNPYGEFCIREYAGLDVYISAEAKVGVIPQTYFFTPLEDISGINFTVYYEDLSYMRRGGLRL